MSTRTMGRTKVGLASVLVAAGMLGGMSAAGGCTRLRCPDGTKLVRGQSPDALVTRIGAPTAVREEAVGGEGRVYLFGQKPEGGEAAARVAYLYPYRGYQVVFEKDKARMCECVSDDDRLAIRAMIEGRTAP